MTRGNQVEDGDTPVDTGDGSDENAYNDPESAVRPDGGRPKDGDNAGDSTADSGNGGGRKKNSGNDGAGWAADGGSEDASDGVNEDGTDGSDEETSGPEADEPGEHRIYHRKVTPEAEEANASLLRLIANLERCEVTDLPPLYDQIDHMVEHLFTEPPPTDAQVELEFTYHGYRIELDQSGDVKFMKISETVPVASDE